MPKRHLSPHYHVASSVFSAILCFLIFRDYGGQEKFYGIAILLLAVFWAVGLLIRQWRGGSSFTVEHSQTWGRLLRRAVARYCVWNGVIALGLGFYTITSYYFSEVKISAFFAQFFYLSLIIGLPYFVLTLKFKASREEDFYDPAIRLIHIVRHVGWGFISPALRPRMLRVLRRSTNLKVLLNLVLRCYYIPVMVPQVFSGFHDTIGLAGVSFINDSLLWSLLWMERFLWLVDSLTGSAAYLIESRWLENRSRSIDLTGGGWWVCLCCYSPLNIATGTLFVFAPQEVASNDPAALIFPHQSVLYAVKIASVLVLMALIYSDLSLGPSGMNITFKKLQDRGPYGIVRHPGTACKLTFWWVQSILFIKFWSPGVIFGQLMWNTIYILRALTEERHLSHFEEYRKYKKRVRYRFIPGLI
jgi:protein-S-isoprenylcysteine O-methyltransferase Ste14